MFTFTNEQFSGPLDLLLQMIEGDKFNITELSLIKVTDDYIAHVQARGTIDESEMADFLIVAAKLLYLKSKELFPQFLYHQQTSTHL